jgi:hypothetical protein
MPSPQLRCSAGDPLAAAFGAWVGGASVARADDGTTPKRSTNVDAAVAAGRLTKAQSDELKQQIESGNVPLFGGPGAFLLPPEGVAPSFATPRFRPLFHGPGAGPPFAMTVKAFAGLDATAPTSA